MDKRILCNSGRVTSEISESLDIKTNFRSRFDMKETHRTRGSNSHDLHSLEGGSTRFSLSPSAEEDNYSATDGLDKKSQQKPKNAMVIPFLVSIWSVSTMSQRLFYTVIFLTLTF